MLDLTPHLWQLAVALVILLLNTELGRRSPRTRDMSSEIKSGSAARYS